MLLSWSGLIHYHDILGEMITDMQHHDLEQKSFVANSQSGSFEKCQT